MPRSKKESSLDSIFDYRGDSNKFFAHLAAHYRQRNRQQVAIRCEVDVVLRNGRIVNSGRASIKNLSATGALLSNFALESKSFPAKPFRMRLRLLKKELKGITIICIPVRLEVEDGFCIGVKFQQLSVKV